MDEVISKFKSDCKDTIEHVKNDLSSVHGNRVSPSLIDDLRVDAYGSPTPLKGLANITVTDNGQGFMITAWDGGIVNSIQRAIAESELGVNPNVDGTTIRIKFPPMTEETRSKRVKMMKQKGEEGKITLRTHRHSALDKIKAGEKNKIITEDQVKAYKSDIDEVIKEFEKSIDVLMKAKEAELMEV